MTIQVGFAKVNNAMDDLLKNDLSYILDHTNNLWDEVRNKRIFITGGTGFFGCWLLESFLHANLELKLNATAYVLTRYPDAFRSKAPHLCDNCGLILYKGDVCNFVYPEGHFSHVIHAATVNGSEPGTPAALSVYDHLVDGTLHLLNFARYCSAQKILFTSSGAVYGKQPSDMPCISEEYAGAPDPTDEKYAYGAGKRESELLCAMYSNYYGIEAKIARCFAFVGPYLPLDSNFAIGNFIGDILRNQPVWVNGDGTPYRSYLYAADLAIWLWTILFKGISNRPYNVGSENEISIAALAETITEISGRKSHVTISSQHLFSTQPDRYVPSTERARGELNLQQTINLEDAIKRTIEWHTTRIYQ